MIEVRNGFKPVFLLDNQKTLTQHINPDNNKRHQQPLDFDEHDYLVTRRMLNLSKSIVEDLDMQDEGRIGEGVLVQIMGLNLALTRDVNPETLVLKDGFGWRELSSYLIKNSPRIIEHQFFPPVDHVSGWMLTDEAKRLMQAIYYDFSCPQFVTTGIGSEQRNRMQESFENQDSLKYLTDPYFFLRLPGIRSTHLHKVFVSGAVRSLGRASIHFDDDPNTINAIKKIVGGASVLVSTPEEAEKYKKSEGVELVDSFDKPLDGPVFQRGVHSDDLVELADMAIQWWKNNFSLIKN